MAAVEASVTPKRGLGDARSRAVWRWQLILAISVITIAGVTALLSPTVLVDGRFLSGFLIVLIVTAVSLGVKWAQVRSSIIFWIIVIDIFAVFLLSAGSDRLIAFLWVFPVTWIATYYPTTVVIGALSLISLLMMTQLAFHRFEASETINFIMILIALGFIATTIKTGAHRNASTKRLLRAQAQRIETTLHRVTEQRERAQRLLDSLDIGVARVGADGTLQLANKRFQGLFSFEESSQTGLARAVEYRARRGTPIPPAQTIVRRAARGELLADELIWLFDITGKWRALRATTRVIEDGSFEDDGLLLIIEEVTERVDPQASHGATMRMISHELRNPLTAVLGHVDLLLERSDMPDPARKQAEVIERAGERMQALIDQALSSAGPASEEGDIDFNLASTALAAVEAFTPTAESRKISLHTNLADNFVVTGDVFRIRQVIDNVLSNAIKYSARAGIVTIRGYHDSERQVVIEVEDSGIGISAEDLPHIFESDFRAPSARASGIPGTGLGLSISRDIATQCGGTLEVQSSLGKGTKVKITLPVKGKRQLP